MKLFKKKNNMKSCCQTNFTKENVNVVSTKGIKVLGSGCAKCDQLERNVQLALQELQIEETIEHITDFSQIALYGVMSTPALVVHGEVVSYGKVLSMAEAKEILEKRL